MVTLKVQTDGAYRGKDGGVGSYGYVVKKGSKTIREDYGILLEERVTNNYAEYMALIKALKWIKDSDLDFEGLNIKMDSQLVVKQINGEWTVNSDNLKDLYREAKELLKSIRKGSKKIEIEHVYRENNVRADELSQLALEDHFLAQELKGEEKKVCPECGEEMVLREGKYGKFWGCSGYPDCKHTENYEED